MTDAPAPRRLAELYRASMAQDAVESEALLAALDGRGSREVRDAVLSQAADNPAQAALLRTLVSLRSDVDALQREVNALRRRPAPKPRPLWAAIAASAALAAVVAYGLKPGMEGAPAFDHGFAGQQIDEADRISAVSFESTELAGDGALFSGDFDS
jgi:hypothetical protein